MKPQAAWRWTTCLLTLAAAFLAAAAPATRPAPTTAAAPPATAPSPTGLKVMSYNIRNSGERDLLNGWSFRRAGYFAVIRAFDPDLLGVQEVLADQHDDFEHLLPDYTLVGVARDDGKRGGEWALIAYRTARFDPVAVGNFWLSETPDAPGTKSWDAACVRICSWARLRDKTTGRELLFANTHWDHVGKVARRKAAQIILHRLPALGHGAAVVLTGDFNSTEDDDWVQSLLHPTDPAEVQLTDSYREVRPVRSPDEATYMAFTGHTAGSRIDFTLHGPEFRATAADIDRTRLPTGRYPSDHFAVTAVLEWR